ncbi:oxidoreductase [Pseudonocardia nigra]|uniref:oxidoreductase n=1 Tax=Pseudonocardia nigra TaxID=1921578 RepID=UPI001C602B0C|nr:NADH:flavin oxidoreductase [Pseudonocardia nigra]
MTTTSTARSALTPVRLGGHELPNRLAVAPMARVSARADGVPTDEMADYYGAYADGGFGLVITEGNYTDAEHSQSYDFQPGLVTAEHVAGWQAVTGRVHGAGALMIAQLQHAGALSQGNPYRGGTVGPSPVRPLGEMMRAYGGSGPWPVPHELTTREIGRIVEGFVAAATHARDAGFDGVEVHAANGYLLDQFLTDYTNRRSDAYGGPIGRRVRLTAEVIAAVREAVGGGGFLVGVRLSQTKVNDFAYRWAGGQHDAEIVFSAVAEAGADYLHVASEGRNWLDTALLDGGTTITAVARRVSGLPVVANGGMHDPRQAEHVLADGHADLLSLARGALANSDLPRRLAAGAPLEPFDRAMLAPRVTLANARAWRLAADGAVAR